MTMMRLALFLLFSGVAMAQLPDAPSPATTTTSAMSALTSAARATPSKPGEADVKASGSRLETSNAAQVVGGRLPDAPVPQNVTISISPGSSPGQIQLGGLGLPKRPSDHFFSFRSDSDAPALRPDKKSWAVFVLSHAAGWGALIAAGRNHRSGENWSQEAPALAAVTVVDYALFKLLSPSMGVEGGAYAAVHYGRAARK